MSSLAIKIFANNPPAILIVLGFLLIVLGDSTGNQGMQNNGWSMISMGVILQMIWLFVKIRG